MVPADSKGVSPAPPYSGFVYVQIMYSYRAITFFGWASQLIQIKILSKKTSYNPVIAVTTTVWANPRSLATTYGITFVFFSSAYLDVSVQRVCPPIGVLYLQYNGLPHSGICGSINVCLSPQLFAAYHALHRLWEPRHPPYALILLIVPILNLIKTVFFCFLQ